MMTTATITYGLGGYLPEHPNGNVLEMVTDHGNGTGHRTTYHPDGTVATEADLTGLPIPAAPELGLELGPEAAAALATLAAIPADQLAAAVTAGAQFAERAGDLYAALEEIAPTNTARAAVEIVTDIALTAALTPTQQETPTP